MPKPEMKQLSQEEVFQLTETVAELGKNHALLPPIGEINAFKSFLNKSGHPDKENLDQRDGGCTRSELLTRFLILCAVLDQGPEIKGVRKLLVKVINQLYEQEIRIFHKPVSFFQEIGISVDSIWKNHEKIKEERAEIWARDNQSNANRYNLYMDNSKQTLSYAIYRWGVPLALPYLLEKECSRKETALSDYLKQFNSSEHMSREVKDHRKYGLGKAIGDKACHLFAKWMVSTFSLIQSEEKCWGEYSFEIPYDSNVGRVLWRTGYLLRWASLQDYKGFGVIQPEGQNNYLRITNIRGKGVSDKTILDDTLIREYENIALEHIKSHKRKPQKIEIQRLQHVFLRQQELKPSHFDDGLIYIGTEFCFNHQEPNCEECPLKEMCLAHNHAPQLITDYHT